jgi:hypothetical protein
VLRIALVVACVVFAALPAFAAITGTVIDENGAALRGATVSALPLESLDQQRARLLLADPSRKPLATAQTDTKGNFSIDAKAPVVDLRIELPGRAPLMERAAANEDAGVFQVGLVPLKQGTIIAGGKPLAGAVVITGDDLVTITDATGHFPLPDPKRIATHITVRHPDYATATRTVAPFLSTNTTIALTRNATRPPTPQPPTPKTQITGTLRDQRNQPIAGAEIAAKTPRVSITAASAITDAKGNYTIAGVPPGSYELTAIHPEYAIPVLAVDVAAGASIRRALYATPLARISGSIVDEDRRGIAAARITARGARQVVSAPDGRYLVRTEHEGELRVDAAKKGLPEAHSETLRVAAGDRKSNVTITIPRGVALAGRVIDRAAKPIAGAAITTTDLRSVVNSLDASADDPVRSAADGTFTLRLAAGTYDLRVAASGYAPKLLRAHEVSANASPLEVQLEPGVEVRGRVTRGGDPVEGVTVFITSGDVAPPVQTAPDGAFRISDLAPGELMLAFRKPDDFIQLTRAVVAPADDVDVELPAGGPVAGRVVGKASGQPVKAFAAGVSVKMRPPLMRNFTSDDGAFTIDNVPAGSQTLLVSAPGFSTARVANVNVENGKGADNVEVALESGVRVSGRVTGPGDAPVGGASVRVEPKPGAISEVAALTDPDGTYVLENVETGENTLAFSRSGLLPARKTVTLSAPSMEVDAKLDGGASIAGVVVSSAGAGIADAEVSAMSAADPDMSRVAVTDGSGAFSIAGAAPGHYEVRASKRGFTGTVQRDVDITTSGALRLVLSAGATIAGHVTGLSAPELRSAVVQAVSSDATATAAVDGSGGYRIDGAPSGTVRVSARAGEAASSARNAPMKSVQIDPGETVTVDFDFAGDITVRGRVTRHGAAVPGASVSFLPRTAGKRAARTSADGRGQYEITGIDEGSYTVNAATYSTSLEVSGSSTFDIEVSGAMLAGRVIDSGSGAAIANANVELRQRSAAVVRSATSDANGTFSFDDLASGAYQASAQKSTYGSSVVAIDIDGGDPAPIEVKLTPSSGLTLKVVDARDRRPLNAWYHAVSTATSAGGSFDGVVGSERIPLAAGSYRVTITAIGYASSTINATAPGERLVALTPGGTIVVSSTSDAFVRARLVDPFGEVYRLLSIDPAPGQTRIANVAAGSYVLQIVDDENRVVRATPVTVGEGEIVSARL